jgi:hypothetical protein
MEVPSMSQRDRRVRGLRAIKSSIDSRNGSDAEPTPVSPESIRGRVYKGCIWFLVPTSFFSPLSTILSLLSPLHVGGPARPGLTDPSFPASIVALRRGRGTRAGKRGSSQFQQALGSVRR